MVDTAPELTETQIDGDLHTLERYLRALPEVEQRYPPTARANREMQREWQAYYYEWADLAMRFEDLAALYKAQRLSSKHVTVFLALAATLRKAAPVLRRLQLATPEQGLLDRLTPPAEQPA